MTFGAAMDVIREDPANSFMRLPSWDGDIKIKIQLPDVTNKMTAPYFYREYHSFRSPWVVDTIDLFSKEWEIGSDGYFED